MLSGRHTGDSILIHEKIVKLKCEVEYDSSGQRVIVTDILMIEVTPDVALTPDEPNYDESLINEIIGAANRAWEKDHVPAGRWEIVKRVSANG